MTPLAITPRDRVNEALAFRRPDRTPRDFAAVPEIYECLAWSLYGFERILFDLAGSHHIQADTPIENVLAVYQ